MQHQSIDGLVVRVRDMGDHDRYLSVLTAEQGRITLLSKGSRSMKGGQASVSQLYTYANFEYYRRGDLAILKSGSVIEPFYTLSSDIDRLDLASYFCDVICEVTDEGEPAPEALRLLLNALYATGKDLYPQEIIKGAFEWRIAALSGYTPELGACSGCGREQSDPFYLDVMNGALLCPECRAAREKTAKGPLPAGAYDDIREADTLSVLSPSAIAALRYALVAPLSRIFAFELKTPTDLGDFSRAAETYLLSHLGRGFDSLNFYHAMRKGSSLS